MNTGTCRNNLFTKKLLGLCGSQSGLIRECREIRTEHPLPIYCFASRSCRTEILFGYSTDYFAIGCSFDSIAAKTESLAKSLQAYSIAHYHARNKVVCTEKNQLSREEIARWLQVSGIALSWNEATSCAAMGYVIERCIADFTSHKSKPIEIVGFAEVSPWIRKVVNVFTGAGGSVRCFVLPNRVQIPVVVLLGTLPNLASVIGVAGSLSYSRAIDNASIHLVRNLNLGILHPQNQPLSLISWFDVDKKDFPLVQIDTMDNNRLPCCNPDNLLEYLANHGAEVISLDFTPDEIRDEGIVIVKATIRNLDYSTETLSTELQLSQHIFSSIYPELGLEFPKEAVIPDGICEVPLSRLYHENSKLRSCYKQGDFMFPTTQISEEMKQVTVRPVKGDRFSQRIALPDPRTSFPTKSIEEVILSRRSERDLLQHPPISLLQLSKLLFFAHGITGSLREKQGDIELPLRAAPSGGALYPIELYAIVNSVNGVNSGIYYYDAYHHCLLSIGREYDLGEVAMFTGYSGMILGSCVIFVLTAVFSRNQWKYKERGYRIILLDCGHVAQNLHLMTTAMGLGSCPIMGFVDDYLNKLLGIDGLEESTMYIIPVGRIKRELGQE